MCGAPGERTLGAVVVYPTAPPLRSARGCTPERQRGAGTVVASLKRQQHRVRCAAVRGDVPPNHLLSDPSP